MFSIVWLRMSAQGINAIVLFWLVEFCCFGVFCLFVVFYRADVVRRFMASCCIRILIIHIFIFHPFCIYVVQHVLAFGRKCSIFKMNRKIWQWIAPKTSANLRIIFKICKFLGKKMQRWVNYSNLFVKIEHCANSSMQKIGVVLLPQYLKIKHISVVRVIGRKIFCANSCKCRKKVLTLQPQSANEERMIHRRNILLFLLLGIALAGLFWPICVWVVRYSLRGYYGRKATAWTASIITYSSISVCPKRWHHLSTGIVRYPESQFSKAYW